MNGRVLLSFDDYQLIRDALAMADGALALAVKAAGNNVNQAGANDVHRTIERASDRLRERAFPEDGA